MSLQTNINSTLTALNVYTESVKEKITELDAQVNNILSTMSTDAERLSAINDLVANFEAGDDDLLANITTSLGGKLGKTETAVNSAKLENKTLAQIKTEIGDPAAVSAEVSDAFAQLTTSFNSAASALEAL